MIIDVHAHIGRFGPRTHTPEELAEYCAAAGVVRAFVSNLDAAERGQNLEEPDANTACLNGVRTHATLSAVYWLRPGRPDSNLHAVAGALDTEPFAAAFFSPAMSGQALDDGRLERYLPVLARLNCPLLIAAGREDAGRPERIHALARKFTRLAVVICPSDAAIWPDAVETVRRSRQREDATLWLATSHATAEQMKRACEQIGVDRMLFGSDALLSDQHAADVTQLLTEFKSLVPAEGFGRVVGGNATELLKKRHS